VEARLARQPAGRRHHDFPEDRVAMEAAMALTNRLLSQAQALAAVTAHLRLAENGAQADPALAARIERVIDVLDARDALAALTDRERAVVTAFARSYLHQALELMDEPWRPSAWSHSDATILQAQGAASAVVATLIAKAGAGGPGSRILDVGTGVARLAIAFCETFPGSTVVGVDPWEPALALARENVRSAGLGDRITLHALPIQEYDDADGFDLVWLPSFFIPDAVLAAALGRVRTLLRPGGRLIMGVIEGPDDALAGAVDAMITVRSGGAALEAAEAAARLEQAGFAGVAEVARTWQAPLRLFAARTANPAASPTAGRAAASQPAV
jgi:SAM-dependent methyltransferase